MTVVQRDRVCSECGCCIGSGVTPEQFDELQKRNAEAKAALEKTQREKRQELGPAFIVMFAALALPVQWITSTWFPHTIMLYILPFWLLAALLLALWIKKSTNTLSKKEAPHDRN